MKERSLFFCILVLLLFIGASRLYAQELSADSLFTLARKTSSQEKNYSKSIALCKQALVKSPDYLDIQIYMGRVYGWAKKVDSARMMFDTVLKKDAHNQETLLTYARLELGNHNPSKALAFCDTALNYNPGSFDLLFLKVQTLTELKKYSEAYTLAEQLVKQNPKNSKIRSMQEHLKDFSAKNQIGINYTYTGFDKQYDEPWHFVSLEYTRQTHIGPVVPRINYANKRNNNGLQFETDFYPRFSKTFYAYINAGIADTSGVFPKYRTGFSLYANLPYSFEVSAGFRYTQFVDATWVYTASIGKYYKSYFFTFNTYLTPYQGNVSQTYLGNARYYFGTIDYVGLSIGTGVSPDVLNYDRDIKLKLKLAGEWKYSLSKFNILTTNFGWSLQEYQPDVTGSQFDFFIGFQHRF